MSSIIANLLTTPQEGEGDLVVVDMSLLPSVCGSTAGPTGAGPTSAPPADTPPPSATEAAATVGGEPADAPTSGVEKMLAWSLKGWSHLHPDDKSTNQLPSRLRLWSPRGMSTFVCGGSDDAPVVEPLSKAEAPPTSTDQFVRSLHKAWPAQARADLVFANALRDLQLERRQQQVGATTSNEPYGVCESRARSCMVEQTRPPHSRV